jgi:hypothetical protein
LIAAQRRESVRERIFSLFGKRKPFRGNERNDRADMKLKWVNQEDLAIRTTPTVRREEYLDMMTFRRGGVMFREFMGPMVGLKEQWLAEGASEAELDFSAFEYRYAEDGYIPVSTHFLGGEATRVLEDTPEYLLFRDRMGRTMKMAKGVATLPLPMDHPVKSMDDWLRLKPHYEYSPRRFSEGWRQVAQSHLDTGRTTCMRLPGGFDEPRQLLGEERLCMAFYDQPELIHDILDTIATQALRTIEEVCRAVQVDQLFVHEDMAGRTGPMIGPDTVRQFIVPYYRRVWDMMQSHGTQVLLQDSDGDMGPLIEPFLEAGVNAMFPNEPSAGMDIVALRERYGERLALCGGLDKHVIARGPEAIDRELEYKLPPMIRTGGCVLGLDHRIPPGSPLENYRYYMRRVWEIIARETEPAS